jgi:putative membrane protein
MIVFLVCAAWSAFLIDDNVTQLAAYVNVNDEAFAMTRFILRALVAAAGLWVAAQLLHGRGVSIGSHEDPWLTLIIAGLVLGVVNAVVRPILTLLTLPVTILTLGLFLLIVNGLMILLTSWVVGHLPSLHLHMHVGGIVNAVLVTIIVWVVSLIGNLFLGDEGDRRAQRR